MSEEDLTPSLCQYKEQLAMIEEALNTTEENDVKDSLLSLKNDLNNLIQLTQENLDAISVKNSSSQNPQTKKQNCTEKAEQDELDDEYALFMQEMEKSGAYEEKNDQNRECSSDNKPQDKDDDSDIEEDLTTLLGMKCAVYHIHKWGGQPTLYNAMVSSIEPRQDNDKFMDLQVRVLFTHPTQAEMLPCPFFLNGECRFSDEQCRYSHGAVVQLSSLKEAIEPDFESVKTGSRVLVKLKPPEAEDISLAKKSTEKFHLWHRALVKSIDTERKSCSLKLEHGLKTGEKRKSATDEFTVAFEEIFPLNNEEASDSDSDDSISDTEYPSNHIGCPEDTDHRALLIEKSLQTSGPAMGEWERHTRGIGSKLMLAMGYVPGTGLGASSDGRLQPVEARLVPLGKSLDHCMALSEEAASRDPLKVELKLKRMQKKEEERNKRAYEREKEKERRNVFNFLNRTIGNKADETKESAATTSSSNMKQSTNKDLNIEQFKITEETKRLEREIIKLNSSLQRQVAGSSALRILNIQIAEKNKELDLLRNKEQTIAKEQRQRKDKQKMTVF